jgi:hypothetical protein
MEYNMLIEIIIILKLIRLQLTKKLFKESKKVQETKVIKRVLIIIIIIIIIIGRKGSFKFLKY